MPLPLRALSAVVSISAVLSALAADGPTGWPQFRGPSAAGIGSGKPPATWNVDAAENIAWKAEVPGLGLSSPIVAGERVYLTTAVKVEGDAPDLTTGWMGGSIASSTESGSWEWRVLAYDLATGKLLWQQTAHRGEPRLPRHPKSSHANSTPATDGKHIVACFGSEGLYCYDRDGKLLWKTDLGLVPAGYHLVPAAQWGYGASPVIHNDQVILQIDANDGACWAVFDLATGKEVKRVKRDDVPTWSTPTVHEDRDRTVLLCNGYKEAAAYDLASGERLWWLQTRGDIPVPTPFVANEHVVITNGHGAMPVYVIDLDARGDLTPESPKDPPAGMAWWHPGHGSYMPTPIAYDGLLYVGNDNGILTVRDMATGERIYRERLSKDGSTYSASAVAADGKLYFAAEDGTVHVVQAGREYKLLASNEVGEVVMATPAIVDGKLLIRGQKHLYCIAATGDAGR